MVTDYNIIGLISALSILKNGPLLRFLNAQIREQMFGSTTGSSNILPLKNGSDKTCGLVYSYSETSIPLSIIKVIYPDKKEVYLPSFNQIFTHGSNQRIFEEEVHRFLVK